MNSGDARAELLRAQLAGRARPGPRRDGSCCSAAAQRLEPLDAGLAREAYREAFAAALAAGRLGLAAGAGRSPTAVRAASAGGGRRRATDLLLDGLAVLVTDGPAVGAPHARGGRCAPSATRQYPPRRRWRWLPFACRMSRAAWDDESWHALSARLIELARQAGALTVLPEALQDGTALSGSWLATPHGRRDGPRGRDRRGGDG